MGSKETLIDCHAHVYPPNFFEPELSDVLAAAAGANVSAVVAVSECLADAQHIVRLSKKYTRFPLVAPSIGLHPVQPATGGEPIHTVRLDELPPVTKFIDQYSDRLVCVGEIGLDYSKHVLSEDAVQSAAQREVQQQVFAAQVRLASDLKLPVNVHSRSAGHYAIELLRREQAGPALLHAFDGKVAYAQRALHDNPTGVYFSVPPSTCRSPGFQRLAQAIPLDRLVLESDAPALAPVKGQASQPAHVAVAAAELARIKGMPLEEVQAATTANALRLFPRLAAMLRQSGDGAQRGGAADEEGLW